MTSSMPASRCSNWRMALASQPAHPATPASDLAHDVSGAQLGAVRRAARLHVSDHHALRVGGQPEALGNVGRDGVDAQSEARGRWGRLGGDLFVLQLADLGADRLLLADA